MHKILVFDQVVDMISDKAYTCIAMKVVSVQAGGPDIPILTGRKDSRQASARLADVSLLPATASMDQVLSTFADKGLTTIETVAIQGKASYYKSKCICFPCKLKSVKR